jgi:hypothetical protein
MITTNCPNWIPCPGGPCGPAVPCGPCGPDGPGGPRFPPMFMIPPDCEVDASLCLILLIVSLLLQRLVLLLSPCVFYQLDSSTLYFR